MNETKIIYYNEIKEFDEAYEEWRKENPNVQEVSQHHEPAENPNPFNGINKGTITFVTIGH